MLHISTARTATSQGLLLMAEFNFVRLTERFYQLTNFLNSDGASIGY
jgi:hypothetical protein